jgi:signal transduction histidine kinase
MQLGTKLILAMLSLVIGTMTIVLYSVNDQISKRERRRVQAELSNSINNFELVLTNAEKQLGQQVKTFFEDPLRIAELDNYDAPYSFHEILHPYLETIGYADEHTFAAVFHETFLDDQEIGSLNLIYPTQPARDLPSYFKETRPLLLNPELQRRLPINDVFEEKMILGMPIVLDGRLFRLHGIPIQASARRGETPPPPAGVLLLFQEITDKAAMSFILKSPLEETEEKGRKEEDIDIESDVIFFVESKVVAHTHFALKDNHKIALNQFASELSRLNRNPSHDMKEFFLDREHFLGVWSKYNTRPNSSGYIVLKSYDRALAPLAKLQSALLLIGFVVILIAILFSRRLSEGISRPILSLVKANQEIQEGQRDIQVPVVTQCEIGMLTESFNRMVVELREKEQMEAMLSEAEIERHRSISEMVAGVAHEINTPIGIVMTASTSICEDLTPDFVESVTDDEDDQELLEDIAGACRLIYRNIERASHLIQRFKTISVHQMTEALEKVSLVQTIEEVISLYQIQSREDGLEIKVYNQLEENDDWTGYPGYLTQVILNFITNIKVHAYDHGGKIDITISEQSPESSFIIRVRDYGKGISQEKIGKIFEAFYTTARNKGGTGLGLSIVYNIVTGALEGEVVVESELDKGTTFVVTIPREIHEKITQPEEQ